MQRETRNRRRSDYAPVVGTAIGQHNYATKDALWDAEPYLTRTTERDDLHISEEPVWMKEDVHMESRFYRSFQKSRPKVPLLGGSSNRMERFAVGDTVLLQVVNRPRASIGVIVSMWENTEVNVGEEEEEDDDDESHSSKNIKIHWFLRPAELPSHGARRTHGTIEIYYSITATAIVKPSDIVAHCKVTNVAPPDAGTELTYSVFTDTNFFCRFSVDSGKGLFYELDWEAHCSQAVRTDDTSGELWNVHVPLSSSKQLKRPAGKSKKGKDSSVSPVAETEPSESSSDGSEFEEGDEADEDEEMEVDAVPKSDDESEDADMADGDLVPENDQPPQTPSKRKRGGSATTTPRKRQKAIAKPTPHSKKAMRARQRTLKTLKLRKPATLSPQDDKILQSLPQDPYIRAMHVLHVGERPDSLPCRDAEYMDVLCAVTSLLEEGTGGCIYISGVPGTGKTATVHSIIRELKQMAEDNTTNPFDYVEINGLRVPEPNIAYPLLWEVISGYDVIGDGHLKISPKEALKRLTRHFSASQNTGPAGHACIVLMDELDQLVTTKQDIIYNFFNWPNLPGSKLIVIAVANTHDLPERTMSAKVRSRLGMTNIKFSPYDKASLVKIVQSRLDRAKQGLPSQDDVMTVDAINLACAKVASVSGDARRVLDICRRAVELGASRDNRKAVTIQDMSALVKDMQNSPTAAYIRECSFHERIMLAVVFLLSRKEGGVVEVKWGDVTTRHRALAREISDKEKDCPTRKLSPAQLAVVLDSLVACRALTIEEGVLALRKPEADRKLILNIEPTEVQRVLAECGDVWCNILRSV